jgi:hypothetical protein
MAHHMNKGAGVDKTIYSPDQARDRVRGTSAIVDGVRSVYCLWVMDRRRSEVTCKTLGATWAPNKFFEGAVVKSNGPADRSVKTYMRNEHGLLECMDSSIKANLPSKKELKMLLIESVKEAAERAQPYTRRGTQTGLYARRSELPPELRALGRDKISSMAQDLLEEKRICTAAMGSSSTKQWLDIPGGPVARGECKFAPGSELSEPNDDNGSDDKCPWPGDDRHKYDDIA